MKCSEMPHGNEGDITQSSSTACIPTQPALFGTYYTTPHLFRVQQIVDFFLKTGFLFKFILRERQCKWGRTERGAGLELTN